MTEQEKGFNGLVGRILFKGVIHCATGMHIGGGKDNMAIGVVDSTVVRDPLSRRPIIPGSSLKGKIRTLISKSFTSIENPLMSPINEDADEIKRLFGSTKPLTNSRLQFVDAFMTDQSVKDFEAIDTELYLSEVKYENTINRLTSVANPRQMERVPAGSEFSFTVTYLIEEGISGEEVSDDIERFCEGLKMLQHDYIGGHGSRGSGRINFQNLEARIKTYNNKKSPMSEEDIVPLLTEIKEEAIYERVGV